MKRREFLRNGIKVGLAANALPLLIGGIPVQAFGKGPKNVPQSTKGKVLVLLQLQGGIDGLNTLVPVADPRYPVLRPTLGLWNQRSSLFPLSDHPSLAFHTMLPKTSSLYESKRMTILQNVGCPLPNLSHFRATDIYETATDGDIYLGTGWMARLLQEENPTFSMSNVQPGSDPLALHFGATTSKMFTAPVLPIAPPFATMEMGIPLSLLPDPSKPLTQNYDPITSTLQPYQTLQYVRTIQQDTEVYNATLEARSVTTNKVTYPQTLFAQQLASVAQLIASGSTTQIYVVTQSGYDFHSNLVAGLAGNLATFDDALYAFQNDLEAFGIADNVVTMTYSEFGRRTNENGSGTDHGTAYPMFVIGTLVKGGILGSDPDLINVPMGNLNYDPMHDFRNVYASIMSEWLGIDDATIDAVLTASNGITYSTQSGWTQLNLFKASAGVVPLQRPSQFGLMLLPNYPNPFRSSTAITFAIPTEMPVRLSVYNLLGEEIARLVDDTMPTGNHTAQFNAGSLAEGRYFCRLTASGTTLTQTMALVR